MKKTKKLSEKRILQITNDIAEQMYGEHVDWPLPSELAEVVNYWRDAFEHSIMELEAMRLEVIRMNLHMTTKLAERRLDLLPRTKDGKVKKGKKRKKNGRLKLKDVPELLRRLNPETSQLHVNETQPGIRVNTA